MYLAGMICVLAWECHLETGGMVRSGRKVSPPSAAMSSVRDGPPRDMRDAAAKMA